MLLLSRNCGTGTRYLVEVYFHHESESKQTWQTLSQNRIFHSKLKHRENDVLVEIEDIMDFDTKQGLDLADSRHH